MGIIKRALLKFSIVRSIARKTKPYRFWLKRGHFVQAWKIRRWLEETDPPRLLQVGSGEHVIPEALNGDIIGGDVYLDATKAIPIPSDSVEYIFTEQFIEHLSFDEARHFVCEARRILKPGGVLRQATPSLEGLIDVYNDENNYVDQQKVVNRHVRNHQEKTSGQRAANFLNDFFQLWGHQFIHDYQSLEAIHREAGFNTIKWKEFGCSDHEMLRNRERHADVEWMKKAFTLICEAS